MRRLRRLRVPPAMAILLGALLGLFGGHLAGRSVQAPQALSGPWHVVSPGLTEGVADLGRGVHVVDGALTITPHVFHRADTLVSQVGPVSWGEVDVASDSGPVDLRVGSQSLRLRPGTSRFSIEDGHVWLEGGGERVDGGTATPGDVEITTGGGRARIQAIRLQGDQLLDQDFRGEGGLYLPTLALGGLLGAVAGALGLSGLWGVLPVALALVGPATWLSWVERLVLSSTSAHELARVSLGAACVPLVLSALSRLVDRTPRLPRAGLVWVALAVAAAALASLREPLFALVGVPALALQPLLLKRSGAPWRWLKGDIPGLVAVGVAGWGFGLVVLAAWRAARLVVEEHADRHPRSAADHLLLHGLVALVGLELGLRSTSLDTGWDWGTLSLESKGDEGWRTPTAGWTGSCGEQRTVVFAGGSSTGGAYQFAGEPEAFFPAQAHRALCERGASVTTINHGFGDRDTFTIARTVDLLAADADVLVLYVGVNDVLTRNHQQTRKQREEARQARSASTRGLAGLARRSRLVTGLSLALRPVPEDLTENPPNVPLADAEENLRLVAARGLPVLLVTEYISPDMQHALRPYQALCASLDEELPSLSCVDAWSSLREDMLVDRNHLSREGNRVLGRLLAEELVSRGLVAVDSPPP